jgi:hypothetical protein
MAARSAGFILVATFLSGTVGSAGGVEPGVPLPVQAPRARPVAPTAGPSPRGLSLARFLESPGKEEGRLQLWLRFNREARAIEEGSRDFLETLGQLTAQASRDVIYSHERSQLEAEVLAAQQEIEALEDAREEVLEELGRADPERSLLIGELAPPWTVDGVVDREALGSVAKRPEVGRVLGRLEAVERRLDTAEDQLLPAAEEALGSALLGLASGEATMLEVVHGLHFLKHQQHTLLRLRTHRELLLLEVARQVGGRVDQLPWLTSPKAG